ncbi:GNAT family N-acetyltransferase [Haloarchaeobius amylolyticus]|uniref:GNAT family N-acetyltransferase n=1 Tax=Haloarchaeobius amylolyticus TaxID=1198296 RepID=UPI002270CA48|nr:GNAT family N-acetyltransferase [Haloarchaeobius amylolyticus]
MTSPHATAVDTNMVAAFVALSDHTGSGTSRSFGDLTAVATDVPVAFFNPVFVFEPPTRDDLSRAVAWLTDQGVPLRVVVADSALGATEPVASDLGLERADSPQPGMVLPSLDDVPRPGSALDIEVVTDTGGIDGFVTVTAAAFGMPVDVARQVAPASMLSDEQVQLLLGRLDGEPVACGLLVRSDDVAGVYNVGVTEPYRRRGFGEAMTRAVLRAGREDGAEVGVLQASEMGYPVYEAMGFETVVEYHQFHPA